jgi:hypothetical protein
MVGLVDHAHAALAQPSPDPVIAELLPDFGQRRRPGRSF